MYRRVVSALLMLTMLCRLLGGTTAFAAEDIMPVNVVADRTTGESESEPESSERAQSKSESESSECVTGEPESDGSECASEESESENSVASEAESEKPESATSGETERESFETESEIETESETETELADRKKLGNGNRSEAEGTVEEDGAPDFVFQAGGFSVLETENGTMGLSDSDSISPLWTGDMDELASELYTAMKAKQEAIDISKYQFQYTESSSGADRKKLMQVYYAVVNDHPDLYYVRTAYSFTYSDGIIKKIKPQYFADMDDAAFMAGVEKAKSVVTDGMDDMQKAIAIHEYLVLTCEYDKERLNNGTVPKESYAAYGVLVNHIAVCQGYALAFKYLMDEFDIECYVVTSDVRNHAWNMVKLNGKYYQFDATWDDPTWDRYGLSSHKYMFISDDLLDNDTGHYPWYVTKGSGTIDITATDTTYDNYFWRKVDSPLVYDGNGTYYYVESDNDLVKTSYTKGGYSFDTAETVKADIGTKYSGLALSDGKLYYNTQREIRQINLTDNTEKIKFALEDSDSSQIYGFTRFDNVTKYVKEYGKTTIYVVDDCYTVTFVDAEGNVLSTQKVPEGGDATPPSVTPPAGYEFTGWQGNYQNVEGNETVIGTWQIQTYQISYNNLKGFANHPSNPLTYTVETESFVFGAPILPEDKAYLVFLGWYLDREYTEPITSVPTGSTGNLTLYAKWEDNRGIWTEEVADRVYTGKAITASDVKVYNGDAQLIAGQDYTISYKNNINVANASAKNPPSLVITARGNYEGTLIKTFNILPVSMDSSEISVQKMATGYQKGKTQKPIPTVTWNGIKLNNGKDFTVTYSTNPSTVGDYQVTITGKGNFAGTTQTTLTITDNKDKIAMNSVKVSKQIPAQDYSAGGVRVSESMITLKYKNEILTPGTDYTFVPETFTNSGVNYVTIEGKGNYVGELRTTFKINGMSVSSLKLESLAYSGEVLKPVITDRNGNTLREGTDYEINSLIGTEAAGKASVNITGKGAYYGTTTKRFTITPHDINTNDVSVAFVKSGAQPYEKNGAKPKVRVVYKGNTLEESVDYTLSYKGNKSVGDTATVTIKGKRNFTGSREMNFTVGNSSLENVSVYVPDKVVSSRAGGWYSTPVLTDTNGVKLVTGKDYAKTIVYTCEGSELDRKKDKVAAGQEIKVTLTGMGNYDNSTTTAVYRILPAGKDLSKASVKINKTCYYNGEAVTLLPSDITVKIGKTTVPSSEYEIVPGSYVNNNRKGTAKVQIRGIGSYGGVKTISFRIYAKKVKR